MKRTKARIAQVEADKLIMKHNMVITGAYTQRGEREKKGEKKGDAHIASMNEC